MTRPDAKTRFDEEGFVILPGLLTPEQLEEGLSTLPRLYPTADEFHDDVEPARNKRFRDDEFAGITNFPFDAVELSLLSVHPQLIDLAAELLGTAELRVYSIEAWAKYTGAADYNQHHHRDYLNHSLLAPARSQNAKQVEMFLYLVDVPADLGPPSYVPNRFSAGLPAMPNWYPQSDGREDHGDTWVSTGAHPDLYEAEVSAAGPQGTVVAYRIDTFHRGTALQMPRGARYTIHVNFRIADHDWIGRRAWNEAANGAPWHDFVRHATPRQLEVFGFPPPGHDYWTDETLAGVAERYPGLDMSPWKT